MAETSGFQVLHAEVCEMILLIAIAIAKEKWLKYQGFEFSANVTEGRFQQSNCQKVTVKIQE